MTPETRTKMLQILRGLADRDAEQLEPWSTFLPLSVHRRALQPDCVVVLGNRGSGKTALFTLVRNAPSDRLRDFFEDAQIPSSTWIDAFSQTGLAHPEVSALEHQATRVNDTALRIFWLAHLLRRVHCELPDALVLPTELIAMLAIPVAEVDTWLPLAEANSGRLTSALDGLETVLAVRGHTIVAAYDTLDRIAQFDRSIRHRFVSALLALWLSLANRYRYIRGKIFLRDDLFESSELGFPDATKLRPRAVSLDWAHADLFRLLVRHIAGEPEGRRWLNGTKGLELRDRGDFGWLPGDMPERVQQAFATSLAGASIGRGVLKTATARWILSRLEDAHTRITPRSLLWFFSFAAESALKDLRPRNTSRLLTSGDLLPALRKTSIERVGELCEEYTLVKRVYNLRAMKLPIEQSTLVERLSARRPEESPPLPVEGDAILRELERLGVLKSRPDGKIDLPDIYRYAFELTPNYGEAWQEYIHSAAPEASAQLRRDLPDLAAMLANVPWVTVGDNEDPDVASDQCERALALAHSAGDTIGEATIRFRIGLLLMKREVWEEALEYFERAAEIFDGHSEQQFCVVLIPLVYSASRAGRHDIISRVVKRLDDEPVLTATFKILAGSIIADDDPPKAATLLLAGLRVLPNSSQHLRVRGLAFVTLAGIVERAGDVERALLLMGIASRIGEFTDRGPAFSPTEPNGSKSLLSVLAERLNLSKDRVAEVQRQANESYERELGWNVIRAAFPNEELSIG